MKKKIWIVMGLSVVLSMSSVLPSMAAEVKEADLLQEVVTNLENGYAEYYDIKDTEVTLYSSHEVDGTVENMYLMEIDAVLKADSVEEMEYYQGISDYYKVKKANVNRLRTASNVLLVNELSARQSDIYEELDEYIGKEQSLVFYIKETYPINDKGNKEVLFENGMDYVSWEEMLPDKPEELQELGYSTMAKMDSEITLMSKSVTLQNARATAGYTYTISDAVNYMVRFTSNPSSCNVCGTGCEMDVDTTKYSPHYRHYVRGGEHRDCANYISQALSDGGIPEDSTWKPESLAWINVEELTDYMTSNGYWRSVSYNQVQKGDIVSYTAYPHVIMITAFDGTTYKYSGHTNDRKNATIKINSSTASSYDFYRVE